MDYSVSIFGHVGATSPTMLTIHGVEQMYAFFEGCAQIDAVAKEKVELLSAARYEPGGSRGERDARDAGVLILDSDAAGNRVNEARHLVGETTVIGYTSFGHTREHEKFRLIFPMTRVVNADEYKRCTIAAREWLAPMIFDRAPTNIASMFYLPCTNAQTRTRSMVWCEGEDLLCPDTLIENWLPKLIAMPLPAKVGHTLADVRRALGGLGATGQKLYHNNILDSTLVPPKWVNQYTANTAKGEHYWKFYQFLCWVALRGLSNGYPVDVALLKQIAHDLDALDGSWYWAERYQHEAERALRWAMGRV